MAQARVASIDEQGLRALFDALDALRRAEEPLHPHHDRAWRVVSEFVRRRTPTDDRRRDDIAQESLLAIARCVGSMDATSPRQAAKWISTIVRRKQIDAVRGDAHDAVAQGMASEAELERVEALGPALPPRILEEQYRRIESVTLEAIEADALPAAIALTRRSMARAAIYRLVLELEPDAIEARLGLAEPVGRDRLYKWIERGRDLVADAMHRWTTAHPDAADVQALAAVVIELVTSRRADAGKARPERRKP